MFSQVDIGGVTLLDIGSLDSAVEAILKQGNGVLPGIAVAINPEKIMSARRDPSLLEMLKNTEFLYPDGMGVSYVMGKKLGKKVNRIPGCELWQCLMNDSAQFQTPVYILGATDEVNQQTVKNLGGIGVNVVGFNSGYFNDEAAIIESIKSSGAQIVSVALGSPKQEHFMVKCAREIPEAFFMGVGGTYDVFTGKVQRAPKLFRKLKCEWLYRLISQPTRIGRQVNLLKYLGLYLTNKL